MRVTSNRKVSTNEITLAFYNLVAIAIENDCRRPAVIFVAVREIRAGVLIHFDRDVVCLQQLDDFRITVGVGIHYVAPVAPHSLEIK
jgi:hypothetical protein